MTFPRLLVLILRKIQYSCIIKSISVCKATINISEALTSSTLGVFLLKMAEKTRRHKGIVGESVLNTSKALRECYLKFITIWYAGQDLTAIDYILFEMQPPDKSTHNIL